MGESQTFFERKTEPRRPARWDDLVERHSAEALRLSYLLTGDQELAQDITQDAFSDSSVGSRI